MSSNDYNIKVLKEIASELDQEDLEWHCALEAAIEALQQADKIAEIRAAIISRQKYLEGTDMSDYGWGKNRGLEEAIEIIDTTGGDDE